MKLRFKYNKIAGLCRIHNIVGSSKDNQGKYIWMRIMKGKIIRAGQDNASSMEGALFFVMATRKMHLTTANQSEIRRAHLVSVTHEPKLWELRQIAAVDNLHKDLRMQDQIAEKVQVGSKKVIHIRKNDFKAKSDL